MITKLKYDISFGKVNNRPYKIHIAFSFIVCLTPSVYAANECGTGQVIICNNSGTPDGNINPYANGISYTGLDQAVTLLKGVIVDTSSAAIAPSNSSAKVGVGLRIPNNNAPGGNVTLVTQEGVIVNIAQSSVYGLLIRGNASSIPASANIENNGLINMVSTSGRAIYASTGGDIKITNGETGNIIGRADIGIYAQGITNNNSVSIVNNGEVTTTATSGTGLWGTNIATYENEPAVKIIQTGNVTTPGQNGLGVRLAIYNSSSSYNVFNNSGNITSGGRGVLFTSTNGISKTEGSVDAINTGNITAGQGAGILSYAISDITNSTTGTISGSIGVSLVSDKNKLTNRGSITGTNGTAISIEGDNNTVILDVGTNINGDINSFGDNNSLILNGEGTLTSDVNGIKSLTSSGALWSLNGTVSPVSGTFINPGSTLQIGVGGNSGRLTGNVINNGTLSLNRADTIIFDNTVKGSGAISQDGSGETVITGNESQVERVEVNQGTLNFSQNGTFTTTGSYSTKANAVTKISENSTMNIGGEFIQENKSDLEVILGRFQPIIKAGSASLGGTLNIIGLGSAVNKASALSGTLFNLIHTSVRDGIKNDFAKVKVGGLSNKLDYIQVSEITNNKQDYNVGFGLSWLASRSIANGVFTLEKKDELFNVDVVLADQIGPFTSNWDGVTLTKNGLGTLMLSDTNTYTGATLINSGTLRTATVNAFATSKMISVSNGGILDINSFDQITNNLSGKGSILTRDAILTARNNTDSLFGGVISGSGSLVKDGKSTLTLSGRNTFSGSTTVLDGTLRAGTENAIASSNAVTVSESSTLDLNGFDQIANNLSGAGDVRTAGAILTTNNTTDTIFSGEISGQGNLVKSGQGTLTLINGSSYIGSTTISGGTLALSGNGDISKSTSINLSLSGAQFSIDGVNGDGTVVQNLYGVNGSLLSLAGKMLTVTNTVDTTFAGDIDSSAGSMSFNGNGRIILSGLTNYTGPTYLQAGSLVLDGSRGGAQLKSDVVGKEDAQLNLIKGATLTGTIHSVKAALGSSSRWKMTGNSHTQNLTNSGVIEFLQPLSITYKNLIVDGDYNGNNGMLVLNTQLEDESPLNDRMIVFGNTSGNTNVKINNIDSSNVKSVNKIELITVKGLSAGEFIQSNRVTAGAYDYYLRRGEDKGQEKNWYLYNNKEADEAPTERPEAGAYTANMVAANTMFVTRLHDRLGETQYIDAFTGEQKVTSMWLRNEGGHNRFRDQHGQLKTRANTYVMQIGGDVVQWSTDGLDRFHIGLMGGYGNSKSNTISKLSGYDAKASVDGYNIGTYGTWYANATDNTGIYLDGWILYGWFNNSVSGEGQETEKYKSKGLTASAESGYTFKIGENNEKNLSYFFQPKTQITWMGVKPQNHEERNGTDIVGYGDNNVQLRLGGKIYIKGYSQQDKGKGRVFQPFIETNWLHNTKDFGTEMDGQTVKQDGAQNIAEVKMGVEGQISKQLNVWGNVRHQIGNKGYNDTSVMLSIKYNF